MRKPGIVIGVIILLIIVAGVVFGATFNLNRYRGTIQLELEKRLDRKVSLGDMHLSLFPPSFRVQDLSIADDPSFERQKPFLQAQELEVSVKLMPLLKKDVQISSLNLQRPSVELIKNQQGVWNFSSLGNAQQPAPNAPAPGAPQSGPPQPAPGSATLPATTQNGARSWEPASGQQPFALDKLVVTDGQIGITNLEGNRIRSLYDHIDVTLKNFAPNHPFSVDAAAHLPGPGTQEVRLQGDGGPIVPGQVATIPFHGTLNLKQVGIAGLQQFLNTPALVNTDGVLSGQTKINSAAGKLTANGQMNVQKPRIHGVDLGYPVTVDYDVTDDLPADVITVRNTMVKLGATPLVISGMVNTKPTPAQIDLALKASSVSITEAAKLAAAAGVAFAPGTMVTGNVNADIQARGAADKPALKGTVLASNVQMSGKDIPQPVQVPSISLTLTPTEIRSNNFNVTSGGTTVNTQFALQQYLSKTPMVNAALRAPNAALPAILAMAKVYGVTGLDKISGAGTLSMDMHAAGPIPGINLAEIMRALNGAVNLNFNDVRYSGTDVSHQLAAIAGFLRARPNDQGFTNILKMTGNVLVKNGIAQTNNLQALLDIGTVGITGTTILVDQALNLHVNAVLSKGFSQQVGGTGIGGYMQTALANNQGELVIPAVVTGTFQHPRFAPDLQQVAQMKLKGLLPNSSNPIGSVSGLVGNLLGQKTGNQAQPQQQQQNNATDAVQQIVGLFGKKKKKQPPPQQQPK